MKTLFWLPVLLILTLSSPLWADKKSDAARERAAYPLNVCVVSEEPLDGMGGAYRHVHKEAGKPDRVIFFCCEGCVDDFNKEPARYLKLIDAAAKEKKK